MAPRLTPEEEGVIKTLSKLNYSYSMIIKEVKGQRFSISKRSIYNILKNKGIRREAHAAGLPPPPIKCPLRVLTPTVLRKIDLLTSKESPPSQRQIARKVKVSQSTVKNAIKVLKKKLRRKTRVHQLTEKHKKNRRRTCKNFYSNYLTKGKSEFVVSLDEALFSLQDVNGKRKVYYDLVNQKNPSKWAFQHKENFCKKFMVVGAISGRGVLPLIKVPQKVKINARYYVDCVLKPLLEKVVPKLYGKDTPKVVVHHDAATSHTAKLTQAYAKDLYRRLGIKIISNSEIPVKSPDASPMDFFGFGYLKQKCFLRRPSTMLGVWKLLKAEWSKIDPATVTKVFKSWNQRCRLIVREKGCHIENVRNLHRKKPPRN